MEKVVSAKRQKDIQWSGGKTGRCRVSKSKVKKKKFKGNINKHIRGQLRWDRELTTVFVKEELVSGGHKILDKISEEEVGVLYLAVWCSQ